jgi:hypothetical protein
METGPPGVRFSSRLPARTVSGDSTGEEFWDSRARPPRGGGYRPEHPAPRSDADDEWASGDDESGEFDWLSPYFSRLIESAGSGWLPLGEVAAFLLRGAAKAVDIIYSSVGPVGPPDRPADGSLFVVDERRLRNWREDGYHHIPLRENTQQFLVSIASARRLRALPPGVPSLSGALSATSPAGKRSQNAHSDPSTVAVVVEWSVIHERGRPPLQRRAIRLPFPSSVDGRGRSQSGAGKIWLVQYRGGGEATSSPRYDRGGVAVAADDPPEVEEEQEEGISEGNVSVDIGSSILHGRFPAVDVASESPPDDDMWGSNPEDDDQGVDDDEEDDEQADGDDGWEDDEWMDGGNVEGIAAGILKRKDATQPPPAEFLSPHRQQVAAHRVTFDKPPTSLAEEEALMGRRLTQAQRSHAQQRTTSAASDEDELGSGFESPEEAISPPGTRHPRGEGAPRYARSEVPATSEGVTRGDEAPRYARSEVPATSEGVTRGDEAPRYARPSASERVARGEVVSRGMASPEEWATPVLDKPAVHTEVERPQPSVEEPRRSVAVGRGRGGRRSLLRGSFDDFLRDRGVSSSRAEAGKLPPLPHPGKAPGEALHVEDLEAEAVRRAVAEASLAKQLVESRYRPPLREPGETRLPPRAEPPARSREGHAQPAKEASSHREELPRSRRRHDDEKGGSRSRSRRRHDEDEGGSRSRSRRRHDEDEGGSRSRSRRRHDEDEGGSRSRSRRRHEEDEDEDELPSRHRHHRAGRRQRPSDEEDRPRRQAADTALPGQSSFAPVGGDMMGIPPWLGPMAALANPSLLAGGFPFGNPMASLQAQQLIHWQQQAQQQQMAALAASSRPPASVSKTYAVGYSTGYLPPGVRPAPSESPEKPLGEGVYGSSFQPPPASSQSLHPSDPYQPLPSTSDPYAGYPTREAPSAAASGGERDNGVEEYMRLISERKKQLAARGVEPAETEGAPPAEVPRTHPYPMKKIPGDPDPPVAGRPVQPPAAGGDVLSPRVRPMVLALVRGWQTRQLLSLGRLKTLTMQLADSIRMLRDIDKDGAGGDALARGVSAQVAADVKELIAATDRDALGGEWAKAKRVAREAAKAKALAEASAAAEGAHVPVTAKPKARRDAADKAALRKKAMEYGKQKRLENLSKTARPSAQGKGDDDNDNDNDGVEDEHESAEEEHESAEDAGPKRSALPSLAERRKMAMAKKRKTKGDDGLGSDLAPSGMWRVVVEVLAARGLPQRSLLPGTRGAGPGMVSKDSKGVDEDGAGAFDPSARDVYAELCLAALVLNPRSEGTPEGCHSADDIWRLEEAGSGRVRVLGRRKTTDTVGGSLAPKWTGSSPLVFPVSLAAGSSACRIARAGNDLPDSSPADLLRGLDTGDGDADDDDEEDSGKHRKRREGLAMKQWLDEAGFPAWDEVPAKVCVRDGVAEGQGARSCLHVRVEVRDPDRFARDTHLGTVRLPLSEVDTSKSPPAQWYSLLPGEPGMGARGEVQLRVRLLPPHPVAMAASFRKALEKEDADKDSSPVSGEGADPVRGSGYGQQKGMLRSQSQRRNQLSKKVSYKVDWSHVAPKTVTQTKLPAGEARTGRPTVVQRKVVVDVGKEGGLSSREEQLPAPGLQPAPHAGRPSRRPDVSDRAFVVDRPPHPRGPDRGRKVTERAPEEPPRWEKGLRAQGGRGKDSEPAPLEVDAAGAREWDPARADHAGWIGGEGYSSRWPRAAAPEPVMLRRESSSGFPISRAEIEEFTTDPERPRVIASSSLSKDVIREGELGPLSPSGQLPPAAWQTELEAFEADLHRRMLSAPKVQPPVDEPRRSTKESYLPRGGYSEAERPTGTAPVGAGVQSALSRLDELERAFSEMLSPPHQSRSDY